MKILKLKHKNIMSRFLWVLMIGIDLVFLLFMVPCLPMELPFTAQPIPLESGLEYILDIPSLCDRSFQEKYCEKEVSIDVKQKKSSEEILSDEENLLKAFDAIDHISIDQLEAFIFRSVDVLLPSGVSHEVQGDSLRSLRMMVHDCLLSALQIHKEELSIYTGTVLVGASQAAIKKNRDDYKERLVLVQSIFFYVLYYMRSIYQVNPCILQPATIKAFFMASFHLALTMATDVNYNVLPFSRLEQKNPQEYMRERDSFRQKHPIEYLFFQRVIQYKMRICLLLLQKDIFMTMPLPLMVEMAHEFLRFVELC